MALTTTDKVKIHKYLREHALGDIYYLDMCEAIGKKANKGYTEFLEFFTNYVITELRKDTKINIKHLTKVISVDNAFVEWSYEEKNTISEDILNKIRSFNDLYIDYINRTGQEIDSDFQDNYIKIIIEHVNELYPSEEKDESLSKYIKEIEDLTDELKSLKKEIETLTREYNNLQEIYKEQTEKYGPITEDLKTLKAELKDKKKDLKELNKTLDSLTKKITELETSLSEVGKENEILKPYKEEYEKLVTELEKIQKQLEEEEQRKEAVISLQEKNTQIESLIYQKLLYENATLEDTLRFVKENGIASTKEEIYNLLRKMKKIISIETTSFSTNPSYQIITPSIIENKQFSINIPKGCKHYDIMLVADFHIHDLDNEMLSEFDKLYDYCTEQGINLILNIGDFYQALGSSKTIEYKHAIANYNLVEKSIETIPTAPGIYHGVLGGNHDKNILRYGYDPIKMLTEAREDFIDLGYTHSTILLKNKNITLGQFDIHHPDDYNFPIELGEDGIDIKSIETYLTNLYSILGKNREDSYIDIFGHTHRSQFNYLNSYYYIPSYTRDKTKKGASHLRIYFDEKKQIKYMVFMPLSVNEKKITKNNEIIYKKILHK